MSRIEMLRRTTSASAACPGTATSPGRSGSGSPSTTRRTSGTAAPPGAVRGGHPQAGHRWHRLDLTDAFADWLCSPPYADYAESYFESPLASAPLPWRLQEGGRPQVRQRHADGRTRSGHGRRHHGRGVPVRVPPHFGDPAAGRAPHPGAAAGLLPRRLREQQLPPAGRARRLELPRGPDHGQRRGDAPMINREVYEKDPA